MSRDWKVKFDESFLSDFAVRMGIVSVSAVIIIILTPDVFGFFISSAAAFYGYIYLFAFIFTFQGIYAYVRYKMWLKRKDILLSEVINLSNSGIYKSFARHYFGMKKYSEKAVIWVMWFITAMFMEEFLFRVFFFDYLLRFGVFTSVFWAAFFSGLMFGFTHAVLNRSAENGVFAFIMGIIFADLYAVSGFWPPLIIHIIWDTVQFGIIFSLISAADRSGYLKRR